MANRKEVPDPTPKERVRPVRQVWEVDLLVVECLNTMISHIQMGITYWVQVECQIFDEFNEGQHGSGA